MTKSAGVELDEMVSLTSLRSPPDVMLVRIVSLPTSVELREGDSVALISPRSPSVEFVEIVSLPPIVAFIKGSPRSTSVEFVENVSLPPIVVFVAGVSSIVSETVEDTSQHKPSACFTVTQVLLSLSLSDIASIS